MINKIIDGIVEAINIEFGDDYEIYTESIEQGLTEPCFSVLILNPTDDLFLGDRYMKTNQFMIQYFPSTNDKNKECNEVLERLYSCLEVIYVGDDLTRGANMSGKVVDEVLNFEINYDMFVYKHVESKEKMEILDVDSEIRG